jgi:hypothetical protein
MKDSIASSNILYFERSEKTMKDNKPTMLSIRQVAQTGLLPEHAIRLLLKEGKLPAIYVGKKALINYEKLVYLLSSLGDDSKLEAEKINIEKTSSDERVFVLKAGDLDESKD